MKLTFESPLPKDLLFNTGIENQMTDAKNKDENYLIPLLHKWLICLMTKVHESNFRVITAQFSQ